MGDTAEKLSAAQVPIHGGGSGDPGDICIKHSVPINPVNSSDGIGISYAALDVNGPASQGCVIAEENGILELPLPLHRNIVGECLCNDLISALDNLSIYSVSLVTKSVCCNCQTRGRF